MARALVAAPCQNASMRRPRPTLALAAVVCAAACATNPATGKKQLMLVSEAQELAMGRASDAEVVAAYGLYADAEIQAYVDRIGQRLAAASERPGLPWSFKVVDDPAVNAFALPGGFIYVTRGILAHLGSEAQLAGVIGHEIGHVTGRHSAQQMSQQQLAMGGLLVGMVAVPELQQYGGLVQQGLGLLFLKFGRDDENEADQLGLRYMTREAYEPRELLEVFGVLDRVTRETGGGRLPDWLSTHPSPGDRATRIGSAIVPGSAADRTVNRADYLRRLDGMVYGENPREGFFQANAFLHPELRFTLAFPRGFTTRNQKQAVVGVSQAQDALVALTLAAEASVEEAARRFLSQQGLSAGRAGRDSIGGLPAYSALFEAATDEGSLRGQVAFVAKDGRVYRILGYTPAARFASYQGVFDAAIRSFRALEDPRYLGVQPKRIEIVGLQRRMPLDEFARVYPSTVKIETIALINGLAPGAALAGGDLAKRVVGGGLPSP